MADDLLKEWQHRLGLDDWRITVLTDCSPYDFDDEDCEGQSVFVESNKTACIKILGEQYSKHESVMSKYDFEETLVHELLHLKTSLVSWNVGDLQERVMHQIIDDLARAFVDAKRCGNPELITANLQKNCKNGNNSAENRK